MRAPKVLTIGDQRLRRVAAPITRIDARNVRDAVRSTHAALQAFRARHGFGRAIAAPQTGANMRLIACHLNGGSFTLFNPEITWRSRKTFELWDDCMSFPDLLVRVRRHCSISLRYTDAHGEVQEMAKLHQAESELLQHEIDHLDGVLAVDRAEDKWGFVTRSAFVAREDYFRTLVR